MTAGKARRWGLFGAAGATRDCPHCLRKVPFAAKVCAYCTRDLPTTRVDVKCPHCGMGFNVDESTRRWDCPQCGRSSKTIDTRSAAS